MKTATLALENGQTFEGVSIGADGETTGEVVFNTSLTGYQEVLTDPSYSGQIVTMTAPQIGNYGVTDEDCESRGTSVAGFVVREASPMSSNWRAEDSFTNYLKSNGIVAIAEIDTRALTRVLRGVGVMRGVIATGDVSAAALVEKARASAKMEGADWVKAVTCEAPFLWNADHLAAGIRRAGRPVGLHRDAAASRVGRSGRVAPDDRRLRPRDEVEHPAPLHQLRPRRAGVPGDDAGRGSARHQAGRHLLQQRARRSGRPRLRRPQRQGRRRIGRAGVRHLPRPPGAGDGHGRLDLQAASSATAAPTIRSSTSRPGKVEITSQNHGFAVDAASLPKDVEVTHLNLYDHTVEGFKHKELPVFCVQYHPEAAPGPHDADYLFGKFLDAIDGKNT